MLGFFKTYSQVLFSSPYNLSSGNLIYAHKFLHNLSTNVPKSTSPFVGLKST
jgi:hypothetical protein